MAKNKNNSFENKKTSELLDLLPTLVDESGRLLEGHEECHEELMSREPFYSLQNPRNGTLSDELDSFEEDIKKLKRHKHDERSGDVVVRI